MKTWNENSKLCRMLLNPEYRRLYENFAKLKQNRRNRAAMLHLARQAAHLAEKTYMERK